MNTRNYTISLFQKFDANGIRYCHWKSNEHLLAGLEGKTDLDVLVHPDDILRCRQLLYSNKVVRVKSQPWSYYFGLEDWVGCDTESGEMIHLHLHFKLRFGTRYAKQFHLAKEELLIQHRVRDHRTGVYILDPAIELSLLLVRDTIKVSFKRWVKFFLKKGFVSKDIQKEYSYLLKQVNQDEFVQASNLLFGSDLGIVLDVFDLHSIKQRLILSRKIRKLLKRSRIQSILGSYIRVCGRLFQSRFNRYFRTSNKRLRGKLLPSRGLIVAVIGCDGSGKSTLSSSLQKVFGWKLDSHHIYLGERDRLKKMVKRVKKTSSQREVGRKSSRPLWRVLLKDVLFLTHAHYRKWQLLKSQSIRMRGGIVFTDRYPQDQYVGINDGPKILQADSSHVFHKYLWRLEKRMYENMTMVHPDIVIRIDVPVEIASIRTGDHSPEELRVKLEILNKINYQEKLMFGVDGAESSGDVLRETVGLVWDALSRQARVDYVEFIGLPGSGKSTIAAGLVSVWRPFSNHIFSQEDVLQFAKKSFLSKYSAVIFQIAMFPGAYLPYLFFYWRGGARSGFMPLLRSLYYQNVWIASGARVRICDQGIINIFLSRVSSKRSITSMFKVLEMWSSRRGLQSMVVVVLTPPKEALERARSRDVSHYTKRLSSSEVTHRYEHYCKNIESFINCAAMTKEVSLLKVNGELPAKQNGCKIYESVTMQSKSDIYQTLC
jgi:thymidylate kinase/energy-coupling factor transporter ATP-binding protein EcfA2